MTYKKGDKLEIEIDHISDGRGVGRGEEDEVILIEGVNYTDETVKVEVINVLEETVLTKKLNKISGSTKEDIKDDESVSPYEIDSDDEYEGEDDTEEEEP